MVRFRNTRTPWIPNDGCSKSRQRQSRKDRNTSKIRAHAKQKTRKQNASHKKQSFGSETPERQQQSSLCQAKNRWKRGFRTMAAQSLVSVRFEKTETPARFEPMPSKKHADRMLDVTFGTHKKKQSFGSETPERQQQSSLCQAKNRMKRGFRTMAAQSLVSVRFEKAETPARFEPMPSKKHANRMLHVTFGTHKKQSFGSETTERQHESSPCQAKNTPKECLMQVTFGTHKKQCLGPAPQHPNASKIRAHKKQCFGPVPQHPQSRSTIATSAEQ